MFQKCVVDVEAKLKADGATALKSLEGAFRICNKSIGDRCVCAFVCVCVYQEILVWLYWGHEGREACGRRRTGA